MTEHLCSRGKQKPRMLRGYGDAVLNQNDISGESSGTGCNRNFGHRYTPAGGVRSDHRSFSACLKR